MGSERIPVIRPFHRLPLGRGEGAGHWVEIEQAVASLRLFEGDSLPHITHTMCDACLEDLGIDEA